MCRCPKPSGTSRVAGVTDELTVDGDHGEIIVEGGPVCVGAAAGGGRDGGFAAARFGCVVVHEVSTNASAVARDAVQILLRRYGGRGWGLAHM